MKPMRCLKSLLLCCCLLRAEAGVTPVASHTLAPGVTLIPGGFEPGRQPDGNTIVWSANPRGWRQGLLVMDTGRHVRHSQAVLDFAARCCLMLACMRHKRWISLGTTCIWGTRPTR